MYALLLISIIAVYVKEEKVLIDSPVTYLKFILADDVVSIFEYDYTTQTDVQELERVYTLTISLFNNQFSVDIDKGAVYIAPSIIGKYVRIVYHSEGELNPFYASSNLHEFITQVLRWTSNRVAEGIYLTYHNCDERYVRVIEPGSFVYEGQFGVFPGNIFDIRQHAPPTVKGQYKAYYMYINSSTIADYSNPQDQVLANISIIASSTMHDAIDSAKLDVQALYAEQNDSTAIEICYVYVLLLDSFEYDIWVEYPPESRTL